MPEHAEGVVDLQRSGRTTSITLVRPQVKNAMTSGMVSALHRAIDTVAHDDTTEVVVLRGAGPDFCTGSEMGDIGAVLNGSPTERKVAFERGMGDTIHPLARAMLGLRQPVVASARGHAIGLGVLFLLAADLVVLSETARISLPQVRLGHTTDHGESWLLPRRVGLAKAMQLCLLGERMSGRDAERFGLANWVTADADLESRTDEIVAGLLAVAPIALRNTKALLRSSADATLETQLAAETVSASTCAATDNFVEAITAQLQRRPAAFTGR